MRGLSKGGCAVKHEIKRIALLDIPGFNHVDADGAQVTDNVVVARHHVINADGKLSAGC